MGTEMPWIDWNAAETTATVLTPPGPRVCDQERLDCVRDLREAARIAPGLIAQAAQLPSRGEDILELVVDRPGIIRANIAMARTMAERIGATAPSPTSRTARAAGKARGHSIGVILAAIASRILGQFDALGSSPRLLLVAPSIMSVERHLGAVPRDFRTWVALHEQTHRVQFANAPWLTGWITDQMRTIVDSDSEHGLMQDLDARLAAIRRDIREHRPWSTRVADATQDSSMIAVLDSVAAVMSLLEGHADVMMDRAGPGVVPTLDSIRRDFDRRRNRNGPSAWLGRLIGMDAKLAQYRDGAEFCRAVIASGHTEVEGIATFNKVFESAEMLPSLDEILHPQGWIDRVAPDSQA